MSIFASDLTDLDHARDPTAEELDRAERLTPIELRLSAALASIPYSIQRKGVPLATIQALLKGKTKGRKGHVGDIARALRKRGWQSRRHWERRNGGEVFTLWYPKGVCPVRASIAARLALPPGRPPKWLATARRLAEESGYTL